MKHSINIYKYRRKGLFSRITRTVLAFPLIFSMLTGAGMMFALNGTVSAEELMRLDEYPVTVDDCEYDGVSVLGAYTNGYDNKMYFSLNDIATMLNGTSRQFDFYLDYEQDTYAVVTGQPYRIAEEKKAIEAKKAQEAERREAEKQAIAADPSLADQPPMRPEDKEPASYEEYGYYENDVYRQNGRSFTPREDGSMERATFEGDYFDEDGNLRNYKDEVVVTFPVEEATRPEYEYLDMYINPLTLNGEETRYYTYQLSLTKDIYMDYTDLQLMLDITLSIDGNGILHIYTDRNFSVDLNTYVNDGYFDLFNGILLGDATTGEILYGCKENNPDAIASTSKLMTYMVVARYLELGRIHMDDLVTISEKVMNLAYSGYGTLYMDAGQQFTIRDLLGALLLASSNESALALAEYVAGSEEAFVLLMNKMADFLGLDSARFYNANGLPVYSSSLIASKKQNYMSATDLFRLSSAILKKYPQIIEYTSQKWMFLETFDYSVSNTNYLLHNNNDVIGLKTGTTDEAGCCLVAAQLCHLPDGDHTLVAVILGAENNIDRYQAPAVLLTWGKNLLTSRYQTALSDAHDPTIEATEPAIETIFPETQK